MTKTDADTVDFSVSGFLPTIGLEIHAELNTKSKMFCSCANNPDEKIPNKNICPICLAHPGTLPVPNKQAIKNVIKVGLAVGGTIADFSEFDRKNYFYPDIPKGYQISQYAYPLVTKGQILGIDLTRIHIEEDTARSAHDKSGKTLVDYNRAGVPLMELVTEPVIHDAKTAGNFARELRLILQTIGASEANMEKGQMRVEANISVAKDGGRGIKVEVKNINSFRSVERAIAFEIKRQIELINKGEKVVQETRGWDETKEITFSQRKKETSHEYRYFPDPDIKKLRISLSHELNLDALRAELPKLPDQKRAELLAIDSREDVVEMFVQDQELGQTLENVFAIINEKYADKNKELMLLAINNLSTTIPPLREKTPERWIKFNLRDFVDLLSVYEKGELSSTNFKVVLDHIYLNDSDYKSFIKEKGLLQQNDENALKNMAKKIIDDNKTVADEFKSGKESALQFLVGQGMKLSKGSANPALLQKIFRELLA